MAISRDEVSHVARLARLELTEEEIERFRGQLSAVLERAQRIQSLDLTDLPPTSHPVELTNVWRADDVVAVGDVEAIIANAPQREETFFRVPRILEEEE